MTSTEPETAHWLMTPEAVRAQARALFEAGLDGRLAHFSVHLDQLDSAAELVCQVIRDAYPTLDVPPHARWRHFIIDGQDHWQRTVEGLALTAPERARVECELAIVSVLLDAGAGPAWRYSCQRIDRPLARSEGLAIASLDAYAAGAFSSGKDQKLNADSAALSDFNAVKLAELFQLSSDNPLEGLEGRAALIQRLGRQIATRPDVFANAAGVRLGNVADYLSATAHGGKLAARDILLTVLDALGGIWPGRLEMAGRNLGDAWPHCLAPAPGLVPFHKLSQWLSYSLFEPLERLGLTITGQGELTGLAEYRNGGLFIDTGVIALRDPANAAVPQQPGSELVVEWRALTVALLDEVAVLVRQKLGRNEREMPLASVLEGGTWAAGRRIAAQLREGGTPPIAIISDGSVF